MSWCFYLHKVEIVLLRIGGRRKYGKVPLHTIGNLAKIGDPPSRCLSFEVLLLSVASLG
jgi:hypothetical protein